MRTKDRAFLDVTSEAINNPIRLTLGWAMVDPATLPPVSLLLAYWMGGAFLMAIKRLAEYRPASDEGPLERLELYRGSFAATPTPAAHLRLSLRSARRLFLAVFLVKYRVEYLLSLPLFAALFASYLHVGLKPDSSAQPPEKLLKERTLVAVVTRVALTLLPLDRHPAPRPAVRPAFPAARLVVPTSFRAKGRSRFRGCPLLTSPLRKTPC